MELNKKQIKAIFITGIMILAIVLLFIIIGILSIKNSSSNKNINVSVGFSSIKDLIEYYGCTYKNDTYKENRDYPTEVNLIFNKKLYENDNSNESFFNEIIDELSQFINYSNFKMIDTENDITIEVVCKDRNVYQIIINGIEDYFIYMDSQLEITKYEKINITELDSNVSAIDFLIENNWSTNVNFGSRESIFKNYNIHFDEGVEYRKIGSSVYNVIFTEKYHGSVINNIKVGTPLNYVKDILGQPAFEDEDLGIIGYKGRYLYVFFTKDEISIYKNVNYDYKDFWKLVDKFLKDDIDFKTFMNELTYIWKDYSEYTYNSDYMFIAYPNRGVEVKFNYDKVSGIILYNNLSEDLRVTEKYLENTEFLSRLKLDSVFEAEKRRVAKEKEFLEECIASEKEEKTKSMFFYNYLEKDASENVVKAYFTSKDGEYPNRELNEPIYTYIWISDNYFVYSLYGKGIYCFDVTTGQKTTIIENDNENFEIQDFKNDILKYDGKEIVLEF